jgi:hypothetical protein
MEPREDWRNFHSAELRGLYSSPNICLVIILRRIIREGRVAPEGDRRGAYRIIIGNPGGNIALERPRRRREDNIKMDLQEIGWGLSWTGLAHDRDKWRSLVNMVINPRVY